MAEQVQYDWAGINGQAVERLKAPKVYEVPTPIVALAQKSWDGVPLMRDGKAVTDAEGNAVLTHNLRHNFGKGQDEKAKAFAEHMRHAGDHTTPQSSVSAVIDPDNDGSAHVVAWKAGKRRGRSTV